jgi:hypothetical protein
VGEIDHPHDTENEHQADSEQRKKATLNQPIDYRLEKKLDLNYPAMNSTVTCAWRRVVAAAKAGEL